MPAAERACISQQQCIRDAGRVKALIEKFN
jgi:hypothetical protein